MIDVTLLGTAALMPLPGRALTAAALRCMGRCLLLDCGEGTQVAARAAGVSLMSADVVALTHYHGDHIFGLPGLLQTLTSQGREAPLTVVGPEGLEDAMAPVMKLAGRLSFDVRLVRLPPEGLRLRDVHAAWPEGARLAAFPTRHRVPSQGYLFALARAGRFMPERAAALGVPVRLWKALQNGEAVEVSGRMVTPDEVTGAPRRGLKVAFTGDTSPCESIVEAAREADLLICEATFPSDGDAALALERGHMTFSQAGALAAEAGARRLWLCHYSQRVEDPEACAPAARARFPGAVCGADGMRMTLAYE